MKVARLSAALSLALVACRQEFDDRDWLIDSVRILAVKSEPPETKPGDTVHFTAFLSSPEVATGHPDLDWRFCSAPKPPTENNGVSSACLSADVLEQAGRGLTIDAPAPLDGCALFGPDTPPGDFRPRDPDNTGGYYQPLRVDVSGGVPTFHLQRISCGLAEASADTASAFARAYTPNHNPSLAQLAVRMAGRVQELEQVPRGAAVDFALSWAADAAEMYAYYERTTQLVTTRRESLRVAWYVDGGKLQSEATGRAEDDPLLNTVNRWSAPDVAGTYHLWIVLRDSRGGADFAQYALTVTP